MSALDIQVGGGHYKNRTIQPVEFIVANDLGFCEGNVVKYVTRWKDKAGIRDLQKARHYLDLLIELTSKRAQLEKVSPPAEYDLSELEIDLARGPWNGAEMLEDVPPVETYREIPPELEASLQEGVKEYRRRAAEYQGPDTEIVDGKVKLV